MIITSSPLLLIFNCSLFTQASFVNVDVVAVVLLLFFLCLLLDQNVFNDDRHKAADATHKQVEIFECAIMAQDHSTSL